MKILALDLSSKSSGWCVGDETNLIDYGCITASDSLPVKRIIKMRNELKKIVEQYEITKVIVEEVRTDYKNAHTYKILTWLQAAIVIMLYEINPKIEIVYIQPSSWRAAIGIRTGRGIKREELKQADVNHVKEKYGIVANDDICDSICIYEASLIKDAFSDCAW